MSGWTVSKVRASKWASDRLEEPYAVCMGRGDYGLTLEVLTLGQVLELAEVGELQPGPEDGDLPQHVAFWMDVLEMASVGAIEKASLHLTANQRLAMLGRWFNGGGGLPWEKDKYDRPRYNLGHRTIFDNFLRWLIHYLSLDDGVDGWIGRDTERLINAARDIEGKDPVTRWP